MRWQVPLGCALPSAQQQMREEARQLRSVRSADLVADEAGAQLSSSMCRPEPAEQSASHPRGRGGTVSATIVAGCQSSSASPPFSCFC